MKRRTTIEIDDELLARAKKALGASTTRATVEQSLRQAAEAAQDQATDRAGRQRAALRRLGSYGDPAVLASAEMWR